MELGQLPTDRMSESSLILVLLSTQPSEKHHSRYLAVHKDHVAHLPSSQVPSFQKVNVWFGLWVSRQFSSGKTQLHTGSCVGVKIIGTVAELDQLHH